jgi:hypothetical protein
MPPPSTPYPGAGPAAAAMPGGGAAAAAAAAMPPPSTPYAYRAQEQEQQALRPKMQARSTCY